MVKATNHADVRPEFVSPKGMIDAKSGVYVVQFRNAATGNVNFQYPNKKVVAEYARSDNLVPASDVKDQNSSNTSMVSNVNTTASEVTSSSAAVSSVQSPPSLSTAEVAPLGTTNND
jgi:hypothetical protein